MTEAQSSRVEPSWPGVAFLAIAGGVVLVCLMDLLSVRNYRAFAGPENVFRCLMAAESFFLIFIWPQRLFGPGAPGAKAIAPALGLGVLSAPLVVVCVAIADIPWPAVFRAHGLLACMVIVVSTAARFGSAGARWYYMIASLLCAGLPLAWYMCYDFLNVKLDGLAHVSPIWAMDATTVPGASWPLWTMTGMAVLAAGLHWFGRGGPERDDEDS